MSQVLPPAGEKPRYVEAMFGRIAGHYDLINTLMTFGQDARWRNSVAELVRERANVLDVGTGTGRLGNAIRKASPTATVVGVDFTEPMLRIAAELLPVAIADALTLPFADGQFDAVVSGFVVRNLADVAAGLREQVRVLRPGGRLVVLETTPGPRGVLGLAFRFYFRRIVPLLGGLIARDPLAYTYLPESTLAFVEPVRLAEVLRELGLRDVATRRMAFGTVATTSGVRPE